VLGPSRLHPELHTITARYTTTVESSVVNKDLTFKAKAKAKDLSFDLKDKFKDCSLLLQLQWRRQDLMLGGTKTKKK